MSSDQCHLKTISYTQKNPLLSCSGCSLKGRSLQEKTWRKCLSTYIAVTNIYNCWNVKWRRLTAPFLVLWFHKSQFLHQSRKLNNSTFFLRHDFAWKNAFCKAFASTKTHTRRDWCDNGDTFMTRRLHFRWKIHVQSSCVQQMPNFFHM